MWPTCNFSNNQDDAATIIAWLILESIGEPLQIFDENLQANYGNLERILNRDDVKHNPVSVISIAGPGHKGKSFLINHFIRWLQSGQQVCTWQVLSPNSFVCHPLSVHYQQLSIVRINTYQ